MAWTVAGRDGDQAGAGFLVHTRLEHLEQAVDRWCGPSEPPRRALTLEQMRADIRNPFMLQAIGSLAKHEGDDPNLMGRRDELRGILKRCVGRARAAGEDVPTPDCWEWLRDGA